MTEKEIIDVVTAFKDGKPIQVSDRGLRGWVDIRRPAWDFCNLDYRVKSEPPTPQEIWVNTYSCGLGLDAYDTKYEADENATVSRIACKKFREVLD